MRKVLKFIRNAIAWYHRVLLEWLQRVADELERVANAVKEEDSGQV